MTTKHTKEELIYLSRLAEQCERFDGKKLVLCFFADLLVLFRDIYPLFARNGRVRNRICAAE